MGWGAITKAKVPKPPLIQSKDLRNYDFWATETKPEIRVAPMLRLE